MGVSARHDGSSVFTKADIDSFSEEVPNMMRPDGGIQPLHGFSPFQGKGRESKAVWIRWDRAEDSIEAKVRPS